MVEQHRGSHALLPSNFWVKFHLRLILIVKGFAKLLFATVRQKIKGILQYPIPAHTLLCMFVRVWVSAHVCVCGCCGLSAATAALRVCGLWFLPGAVSQWAAKLLQFECVPLPSRLLLPFSGNAFKQQFNSSLLAFCYWWGFRFCILPLLIDVRRVFAPPLRPRWPIYGNCAIFSMRLGFFLFSPKFFFCYQLRFGLASRPALVRV